MSERDGAPTRACCVYAIASGNRTYVGYTVDFPRRLRQHNGIIKGGAKATRGRQWEPLYVVAGPFTDTDAMQLEWRLHHPKPKRRGADRKSCRLRELHDALSMPRWTKRSRSLTPRVRKKIYVRLNRTYASSLDPALDFPTKLRLRKADRIVKR